ncbi:hypothetical protein AAKU55_003589 [Oxalobacteraceae bacterium GrIS 1.11]
MKFIFKGRARPSSQPPSAAARRRLFQTKSGKFLEKFSVFFTPGVFIDRWRQDGQKNWYCGAG